MAGYEEQRDFDAESGADEELREQMKLLEEEEEALGIQKARRFWDCYGPMDEGFSFGTFFEAEDDDADEALIRSLEDG